MVESVINEMNTSDPSLRNAVNSGAVPHNGELVNEEVPVIGLLMIIL